MTDLIRKPECEGCGLDDYEGDLRECPFCGANKCSNCDMGDDVLCPECPQESP